MLAALAVVPERTASLPLASRKVELLSVMALAAIETLPLEASPAWIVYSKVKELAVVVDESLIFTCRTVLPMVTAIVASLVPLV